MDSALSKRLILGAMAGLSAAVASCGGSAPGAAAPAKDEQHHVDKNSCAGGPGHSCGAHAPAAPDDKKPKEVDAEGHEGMKQ